MQEDKTSLTREQKDILLGLFSSKETEVINSIEIIRNKGGEYSIKPLMEVYFSTAFPSVRNSIYDLVCDLKSSKTADIFAQNIEVYSQKDHLSKLLSAFWQSAIKFSVLLPFIRIFNLADSLAAVEILTIVEQNAYNTSDADKKECIHIITAGISDYDDFKKNIAEAILEVLK